MEIPDELVEKIANYLGTKPYFEVVRLISEIQKAAKSNLSDTPDKDKET